MASSAGRESSEDPKSQREQRRSCCLAALGAMAVEGCPSPLAADAVEHVQAFAGEVAASLMNGTALQESKASMLFREAALAWGRAPRCGDSATKLRRAFVGALLAGVAAQPALAKQLQGEDGLQESVPPSRIKVRGTAGRIVLEDILTVGSAHECTVQIGGDPTVLALQCVVVAMPGGTVLVDAWSGGSTIVVARGGPDRAPAPVMGPVCDAALLVGLEEEVVVQLGERTKISLEPRKGRLAHKPSWTTDFGCASTDLFTSRSNNLGQSRDSCVKDEAVASNGGRRSSRSRTPPRGRPPSLVVVAQECG